MAAPLPKSHVDRRGLFSCLEERNPLFDKRPRNVREESFDRVPIEEISRVRKDPRILTRTHLQAVRQIDSRICDITRIHTASPPCPRRLRLRRFRKSLISDSVARTRREARAINVRVYLASFRNLDVW